MGLAKMLVIVEAQCFSGVCANLYNRKLKRNKTEIIAFGASLVAQWVRFRAPNAGGPGSIPGQGIRSHMHAATKSLHATTKETT